MKLILIIILNFLGFYLLYLKVKIKGSLYEDKRVLLILIIMMPLVYILIQLIEFNKIASLVPLFIFSVFGLLLHYFWYCMYKVKKIIESKHISLDYEPIVWPLFINNIIQISKKIKDEELARYVFKIKIMSIIWILIFLAIIFLAIFKVIIYNSANIGLGIK